MDEYRFRTQTSPRNEASMNSLVSPPRNGGGRIPQTVVSHDPRTTLPRRFTADSGRTPTLASITTQRPPEPQEFTQYKVQLLEKKKADYERIREQRRRFEAEMQKLDQQQRTDELTIAQMEEDLAHGHRNGIGMPGHQSEPTTPPEYRETSSGFPTFLSRPNRYSASSLVSPPGLYSRPGRSGSQLASPQSAVLRSGFAYDDGLPSRSVPGSRRNSDEDEKEEALRQDPTSHRSTNHLNRYSMPVTRRSNNLYDNIDQTNTTGFLFRDDETTMDSNFSGMNTGDEGFPKLYTQKNHRLSTSSVAVDLTSLGGTEASNGWGKMTPLHRSQQSLTALTSSQMNIAEPSTPGQGSSSSDAKTIGSRPPAGFRHSLDLNARPLDLNYSDASSTVMSPSNQAMATPPKLQSSYSANDITTVKTPQTVVMDRTNANAHAQQHFHNHNASIGRIPPGAVKRHSRELSGDGHITVTQSNTFPSIGSTLHANAPTFGPPITTQPAAQTTATTSAISSPSSIGSYPSYYGNNGYGPTSPNGTGYSMPLLAMQMGNMALNGGYSHQNFTGFAPMYSHPHHQPRDSQQRVIQQRRAQDNEAMSKFQNMTLDSVVGTIYDLCKDQHGCRFLQKQLDNRDPDEIHMIWLETNQHVVDLMMDPFGNYLCQKLLEYCTDDERTALISNASPAMVRIAVNQHGTRALQKMIEFVSLPDHVQIIVNSLRHRVVPLIQDLNGNHVIQKCLNKLSPEDAQFIFDAVGNNCIEVGTHRHGCCVLQRCIDHASGPQKKWLIGKITENTLRLVQDPFGNYVVQYIIDLSEPSFTEPLIEQFRGQIGKLSKHKFSSNVIEKCLRCANETSREKMVGEMLLPNEMDKLLRDSFGNYVVQTALEHTTFQLKSQLIEAIRPALPMIRSTPYGRRLQAKITAYDSRGGVTGVPTAVASGQITSSDHTNGAILGRPSHSRGTSNGIANRNAIVSASPFMDGHNGGRSQTAFATSANAVTVPPPQPPRMNPVYGGFQPGGGEGHFF